MACEYRDKQIMLLNLMGAGCSEEHGQARNMVVQ
jgi:hypothetical protein